MTKFRYGIYFSILAVGIFANFWLNHGWQVSKYYRQKVQPLIEKHMQNALRNENIVVSLTTTPYRIAKIQPVLETLYKQNINIKQIYLSVPYAFKRDNIAYAIPEWLLNDPRVTILRTTDFGPATKLLGLLEQEKLPPNTIIITVDDDMYYPSNLILHLAYAAKKHPKDVITLFGGNIAYDDTGKMKTRGMGMNLSFEAGALVNTILGYAGVAYRAEFFDQEIFALDAAPPECFLHDDFYISFHLARRQIPRRNLDSVYVSEDQIKCYDDIARQPESLYIVTPNRAKLNIACLAFLQAKYPNVRF